MREGTGNCSLFSWALEDALLRFVTHSRYNFGTFEKRERRWFSVYATPAKAFSVFPNLLCKQGAAGSSPATSTNLFPFKKIARESVPNSTCYSSRGSGFEFPHVHQNYSFLLHDLRCIYFCEPPHLYMPSLIFALF